MAYDPSDDQNPLKYVSDAVLGRSQAKAPVKPQTYAGYNRAPMANAQSFPLQDLTEKARATLGPLAGQLREAVSPLAHQEPVNLSRMYHHMRQATGAEPPPNPHTPTRLSRRDTPAMVLRTWTGMKRDRRLLANAHIARSMPSLRISNASAPVLILRP